MPNRERFREQRSIDRDAWRKAGGDGFLGLGVPAEYGGSGVDEVARSFVDARVTRIWAGTNEIMKEVIARSLGLEEPRG